MLGIPVLLCLLLTSGTVGSDNATAEGNIRPFEDRSAKDGVYIGCFDLGCLQFDYNADHLDNLTTPDSCTATCKENGFPLAGVYNGTKCSCTCEQTCLTKSLDDKKCGLPCRSAPTKLCGAFTAVSLYTVHQPVKPNESVCKLESSTIIISHHDPTFLPPELGHFGPVLYITLIGIGFFIVIMVIVVVVIWMKRSSRSPASPLHSRYRSTHSDETPRKTSDGDPYHLYADMTETEQQGSSVTRVSQVQSPSSEGYYGYAYADHLKPKPETSDSAVANEEEGYIIPDRADGPSPSPRVQVVYSSKIPRHPGKGEGLCSQSTSPSVYYSSRIDKSEGK